MYCFNGSLTADVFAVRGREMRDDIATLSAQQMDGTDKEAWVDYFVAKYQIDLLTLHPEAKELDIAEEKIQQYNAWPQMNPFGQEYIEVPGIRVTCTIPFTGDEGLFELTPTSHTLDSFEIDGLNSPKGDGVGYIVLANEWSQREASSEKISAYFERRISEFVHEVNRVNEDAKRFNGSLRGVADDAVDKRVRQLDKLADIRKGLDLPLSRAEGVRVAKPIVLPKKKLSYSVPQPSQKDEPPSYSVKDDDYLHIVDIIDGCCSYMEQAPRSYAAFGEEQLRDHILSVLNTHYENATGETFRNKGKTDIYIPFKEHAAYIAECKIWHGRKLFLEALSQLFSYTTWRDTKVSVVAFNKEVTNFAHVLDEIDKTLKDVAVNVSRKKKSQWFCEIQNQDDERVMHVSVQVFNLHFVR